jgi:hypothetical protein
MALRKRRAGILLASALFAHVIAGLTPGDAVAAKHCRSVNNPYPNSRYEGVDLTRIRASGVPCSRARDVARRAHKKALRMTPPPSGILNFRWHRWSVRGDLRPSHDRYRASRQDTAFTGGSEASGPYLLGRSAAVACQRVSGLGGQCRLTVRAILSGRCRRRTSRRSGAAEELADRSAPESAGVVARRAGDAMREVR